MRSLRILLVVAMFAVIGVGVIHADEDNGIPVFGDGRVNNWQIDAPVAVYCLFDNTENVNVGIFQQIAIWGLNNNELLHASAADINAAEAKFTSLKPTSKSKPVTMMTLDSADGYTLSLLKDDTFQVSAPNGYVFNWKRGDTGC